METKSTTYHHPELAVAILAAGQGKRMYSKLPKVMHELAAKPLLSHVLDTAMTLAPASVYVVYGHCGEYLKNYYENNTFQWVYQEEQLGTGHALNLVLPHLQDNQRVLVLYGDVPLLTAQTLARLIATTPAHALGLLAATVIDPTGLGRIVRTSQGTVKAIVEERDADAPTRAIREIYSGIMVAPVARLREWLKQINNKNSQGEYYLTSIVELAIAEGMPVVTSKPDALYEIAGVNDRCQLAELERIYQLNQAKQLALAGVTISDLNRLDIRGEVIAAKDSFIDINVILEGRVILGENCRIGANCILKDVEIAEAVEIRPNSIIEGAKLEKQAVVGPFARIRPGTLIGERAVIGNFVEIKKTSLGEGSKASHLSYLGDASIGKYVNIGAGTITCNYDGVNKHKTVIENNAFIGSNTSLVAPIHIGEGATLGAGSTVSKTVPAGQLTVARAKSVTLANWKRPEKSEE